jgi:hypothetical protein
MMRNRIANSWNVAAQCFLGSIALASVTFGRLWLHAGLASATFACSVAGRFIAAALLGILSAAGLAHCFAQATFRCLLCNLQHIVVMIPLPSGNSFNLRCRLQARWRVI